MEDNAPSPEIEPDVSSTSGDRVKVEIEGRIIWQVIGAILLTLFLLWAVRQASTLVAMIAISFFFSLALDPGVRWLSDRYGWRRGAAVGVIYLAGAVFVVFMVLIMIPAIAQLAEVIGQRGSEWITDLKTWMSDTFNVDMSGVNNLGDLVEGVGGQTSDFAGNSFGSVVGIASAGAGFLFHMATIAMFTFYFAADMPRIQKAVLRLFNPKTQQRVGWTWDTAIEETGGYFYSRLLLMLVNGLGFFFTMVLVGIPVTFSLALALFAAFVSEFIPVVGTYIGGAVPVLLAAAFVNLTAAIIVLAYVLIYQQIENYWLSPKLSEKTMTLSGGVAFGAALAGGAIAGPMGAFTALPVAALITSFMSNYLASREVFYHTPEKTSDAEPKESRRSRRKSKAVTEPATADD